MVKRISNPKKKILLQAKKFKEKKASELSREELDELIILLSKMAGFLK